ncbi:MAG: pantetheine-phosphate adenylyltransferase, partial [Candidatus Roizmanbacteria bacterium]|nr:pantetheine-phosphate adenylyltransferase [Candidatus Roizmanbacteria bacterium]
FSVKISSIMRFKHVVCGGTFDHLHSGHKKLLISCFQSGEKVTIGITSGAMVRHKPYNISIESYTLRKRKVLDFALQQKKKVEVVQLRDIYGPTIENNSFESLFVTKDTLNGGNLINNKRIELGMKPLLIQVVPFEYDEKGEKISSERIRQGVIDRNGNRYDSYLFSKEKHILPESLKGVLRKPLGRVISSFSSLSKQEMKEIYHEAQEQGQLYLCTVGDMVTYEMKKRGIMSLVSIIDGLTLRKALNSKLMSTILERERSNTENEKGTIQKTACIEIQRLFNLGHQQAIKQVFITGEEDLLTLVAVLFAPLDAHIWYGQQGIGAVDVRVTEKMKQTVYNLLKQFE